MPDSSQHIWFSSGRAGDFKKRREIIEFLPKSRQDSVEPRVEQLGWFHLPTQLGHFRAYFRQDGPVHCAALEACDDCNLNVLWALLLFRPPAGTNWGMWNRGSVGLQRCVISPWRQENNRIILSRPWIFFYPATYHEAYALIYMRHSWNGLWYNVNICFTRKYVQMYMICSWRDRY